MKYFKKLWLLAIFLPLLGCQQSKRSNETFYVVPYQEEMVVLQNLKTRTLVYCYSSPVYTADDCALEFKQKGFVRLKDIPKLPAEDDFLKADSYPTRRWRKDELIPRW